MKSGAQQDDGSERFWRLRARLELIKTGAWIVLEAIRSFGPF